MIDIDSKKKKILIIIGLVIIIAVAGYFAYTYYAGTQYDSNLKAANADQKILSGKVDEFNELGNKIENKSIKFSTGMNKRLNMSEGIVEIVDNQTKSLKQAKQFATSDVDRKYIELLLENRAKLKEAYKLKDKVTEKYVAVADENGNVGLGDMMVVINLVNKADDKSLEVDTSRDNIKEFLEENPDFKNRIKGLGIEGVFLGEKSK